MKVYAAIDVYYLNPDGTKEYIPNAEVKIYDATNDTLLATVSADANGVVWPGELDVAEGTPIYYEYEEASVLYRGGQGVLTEFLYQDIVVADDPAQSFYPTGNQEPVALEVYIKDSADPAAAWRLHERFAPTAIASLPINMALDRELPVTVVSVGPDGTRSVSEINHAPQVTVPVQREIPAPTLGQVGAATSELLTVGVTGFTQQFARRRKVRVADNPAMTDASVVITDYNGKEVPKYVDIMRGAGLVPDFSWDGVSDPASSGFAKTGAGTTASATGGWRINTLTSDGQTYYSKSGWPATPFAAGFTFEITPPTIDASDGAALPNQSVCSRIEDGGYRYELTFDGTNVKLNGGTAHAHGANKVRLVIATGGATADLWIGDTLAEDNTAGQITATSGLRFGDLTDADDANVIWKSFAYALSPQPLRLAQTIYVKVSHSSGGSLFGPESDTLEVSFASESGSGGSSDTFDPEPRDTYEYY